MQIQALDQKMKMNQVQTPTVLRKHTVHANEKKCILSKSKGEHC